MDADDLRRRLADLGAERLAALLVSWTDTDPALRRELELIALEGDPSSLAAALRRRVAGLKRAKKFIPNREAFAFAHTLDGLLERVHSSLLEADPDAACSVLESFLQTDEATFERVDDSSGSVGDSFRWACRLFLQAAARAKGRRDWVRRLHELASADDYGVREPLLEHADELLSEHELRRLAKLFEEDARRAAETDDDEDYSAWSARARLTLVSRALRDPRLEERLLMEEGGGGLNEFQRLDLARRCLEYGEIEEAERHLRAVPETNATRWDLLAQCHERAGRERERLDCLWKFFELTLSWETFQELSALLPEPELRSARSRAREAALRADEPVVAARLLLQLGLVVDADRVVADQHAALDGSFYTRLRALAELARSREAVRIEMFCYRALLDDILDDGRSRAYGHAARYLKRLAALDATVTSYAPAAAHEEYVAGLRQRHGRKYSFWQRVEG